MTKKIFIIKDTFFEARKVFGLFLIGFRSNSRPWALWNHTRNGKEVGHLAGKS